MMMIMNGIFNERVRQAEEEGYSAEHDDGLVYGELAYAAAAYAVPDATLANELWPFDNPIKRSINRRKDLVKAAALIVAEIERINRLEVLKCS